MMETTAEHTSVEETDKRSSMPGERLSDIAASSPDYSSLAATIASSCEPLLCHGGTVVDLRCGRGHLISALLPLAGGNCHFVAFDDDQENVEACEDRFRWLSHQGFVQVSNRSLGSDIPSVANCLTIEEFGMGRLDEQRASDVLIQSRRSLHKGGAIVIVERADRPWVRILRDAGFRNVVRVWRRGGSEALLAEK